MPRLEVYTLMSLLYMDVADINSGSNSCGASILPSGPSLPPPTINVFKIIFIALAYFSCVWLGSVKCVGLINPMCRGQSTTSGGHSVFLSYGPQWFNSGHRFWWQPTLTLWTISLVPSHQFLSRKYKTAAFCFCFFYFDLYFTLVKISLNIKNAFTEGTKLMASCQ